MTGLMPPVTGLLHSLDQFDQAASQIAKETVPGSNTEDTSDLSVAAVALVQSKNSFDANTKVFEVADEMDKALINMIG